MKDEIKEILNQLEIIARKHTIEVCEDGSKIESMPASVVDELRLNNYSSKLLLDYITNLQEKYEEADNDRHKLFEQKEKAIECINHYAVENEDYSKINNDEEKELLNILKD